MKHVTFLFIGLFLLVIAAFHDPLYAIFPSLFEPIIKFTSQVGVQILYFIGLLALIIALFSWLPTWFSLSLFVIAMFVGGYYLSDKDVSISIASRTNFSHQPN
jgi:hypothetical protein